MRVETRPANPHRCITSDAATALRTECLAVYLNTWQGLADRNPDLRGVARDLRRCAERNLVAKKRRGKPYSCKRPGCPHCAPRKQEETANRIVTLFAPQNPQKLDVIAGRFATQPVPVEEVGRVVSGAINAWARAVRAKSFAHAVVAWARIIEIRPSDIAGLVQVRINVVLRLVRSGTEHALELAFYRVSGLLSTHGWRPVEVIHFNDNEPLANATTMSASGFDPRNFCCDGEQGMRPEPDNLLPLHKALHNRRLVTFGGETHAMTA